MSFVRSGYRFAVALLLPLAACSRNELVGPSEHRPVALVSGDAAVRHVCADSFVVYLSNPSLADSGATTVRWEASSHLTLPSMVDSGSVELDPLEAPSITGMQVPDTAVIVRIYDDAVLVGSATRTGPSVCATTMVRVRTVGLLVGFEMVPATDSVPLGTVVSYRVTAAPGLPGVHVYQDGVPVSPWGTFVADTEKTLSAIGDDGSGPTVPHVAVVPLVAQARALLSSPNKVADAGAMIDSLFATLGGPYRADSLIIRSQFAELAFDPDSHMVALWVLDSVLAGKTLPVRPLPDASASLRVTDSFPAEPTAHFVVNGVFTGARSLEEAAEAMEELWQLNQSGRDTLILFHNPTIADGSIQKRFGNLESCLYWVGQGVGGITWLKQAIRYCTPVFGSLFDDLDPIEAMEQIVRTKVPSVVPPRHISLALRAQMQSRRVAGYHAIVYGHSQGTLIAREAIAELDASHDYRLTRDSTCVATVAMGGPVSGSWMVGSQFVKEYATDGDIVADIFGSTASRVYVALTAERDAALASLPFIEWGTGSAALLRLYYGKQLHSLSGTYLKDPTARATFASASLALRHECELRKVDWSFGDTLRMRKGEMRSLPLYLTMKNHAGRTAYGRQRHARSLDTMIVRPGTGGAIWDYTALDTGFARIEGRAGNIDTRDTLIVVVEPARSYGSGGAYAGSWTIPSVATDSLSISVTELDEANIDGFTKVSGSVTYKYGGTTYTRPMVDAYIHPGINYPELRFRMATPEFPDPAAWAEVKVEYRGTGQYRGGAMLYFGWGGFRESRIWTIDRP